MNRDPFLYYIMAVCVELKLTLLAFIFIEAALAETLKNEITLDWNNHPNGTYSLAQAINDFGNMKKSRWDETKVDITDAGKDNTRGCRVKMLPNELSEGGCGAEANIEPGQEYEVDFDMKFHSQFSWSGGGKVGFGFKMGQGNKTGCRPAWDGNGGSLRLVWIASGDRVFLRPYVYHYQMPKQCGDFFNKTYPVTENLKKGSWYHVSMYAKSNTGKNSDGWIRIVINNDAPLINEAIQWTANDEYRLINILTFMTFRGGSSDDYKAPTTDFVYYDNLKVKKLS